MACLVFGSIAHIPVSFSRLRAPTFITVSPRGRIFNDFERRLSKWWQFITSSFRSGFPWSRSEMSEAISRKCIFLSSFRKCCLFEDLPCYLPSYLSWESPCAMVFATLQRGKRVAGRVGAETLPAKSSVSSDTMLHIVGPGSRKCRPFWEAVRCSRRPDDDFPVILSADYFTFFFT